MHMSIAVKAAGV